jgi:hypothetical protein
MNRRAWMVGLVVLTLSTAAYAQRPKQGIGVRLGDPVGLTYKKYLPRQKAIEFNLGAEPRRWRYDYYRDSFHDHNRYENYHYLSHQVRTNLCLQGRYLMHYDLWIEGMEGKWQWYWGPGGVLKFATINYRYQYAPGDIRNDQRADVAFGPEGIIGSEYTFEDVPITIFGELSLMIELVDNPAAIQLLGGAGVRVNF